MISSSEASRLILSKVPAFGTERVDLSLAVGRVLAVDVMTDREMPPFDRVMMDGIGIKYAQFEKGQRSFEIEGVAAAGAVQQSLRSPESCIEVMTGAILPNGCDTVIRYEDTELIGHQMKVADVSVREFQNIHAQGKDFPKGEIVLPKYHKLKPIDVNVLASVGIAKVEVMKLPKVAVVSTGDELVDVGQTPLPHQIRKSNVHMLAAGLSQWGVAATMVHLPDQKEAIEAQLQTIIGQHDVVLMSGGVSKGKFDYVPDALEAVGVQKRFHRVAQRPGKPFWFGESDKVFVFAFPGNPLSTAVCFYKYFVPWLSASIKKNWVNQSVILSKEVSFRPSLTYFAQASIENVDGQLLATVSHGNGSGDIAHPTTMSGFVELPSGQEVFQKGMVVPFIPFDYSGT